MSSGQLNLRTVKLGDNADTSKNFLIQVPAVADGTLSISRESGTAVATVDATGKVAFPGNAQTWQDVKASRVAGTTYTNTTGQPITAMVSLTTATNAAAQATIAGLIAYGTGSTSGVVTAITFMVPAGATYSCTSSAGTPTIATWLELR